MAHARVPLRRICALAALLVAAACVSAPSAAAQSAPAQLADAMAERWTALQDADGSFPESVRPRAHWGGYAEPALGHGLILAGLRAGRADWVQAGARAQRWFVEHAADRRSVFANALLAAGYNLLRQRAPRTPAFAAGRASWERYLRAVTLMYLSKPTDALANKYLVETVAVLELARTGLTSTRPGAVLNDIGAARRKALDMLGRRVPLRVDQLRGVAAGHRTSALSDPGGQPLAYHTLTAGFLARAIELAGPHAPAAARRALTVAVRTTWALQSPDGDLSYIGRSQGQSWALALAAYAARSATSQACTALERELQATGQRALGRLRELHAVGADGLAIIPSAFGPATLAALDDYAGQVVYNGLTLTGLEWAASAPRRCRAGRLLADRPGADAVLPFGASTFAVARSGPVWMAVKRAASEPGDSRYAYGLRTLKLRDGQGRWRDLLPATPRHAGRPVSSLGPSLLLADGRIAAPHGTSMRVSANGEIRVKTRFVTAGGTVVRSGVVVRFTPTAQGAKVLVPTQPGDRVVFSALTEGQPHIGAHGVDGLHATVTASDPVQVVLQGPLASASSLDVWRADLIVGASGHQATFTVHAP